MKLFSSSLFSLPLFFNHITQGDLLPSLFPDACLIFLFDSSAFVSLLIFPYTVICFQMYLYPSPSVEHLAAARESWRLLLSCEMLRQVTSYVLISLFGLKWIHLPFLQPGHPSPFLLSEEIMNIKQPLAGIRFFLFFVFLKGASLKGMIQQKSANMFPIMHFSLIRSYEITAPTGLCYDWGIGIPSIPIHGSNTLLTGWCQEKQENSKNIPIFKLMAHPYYNSCIINYEILSELYNLSYH